MFGPSHVYHGTMASADFSQFVVTTFPFEYRLLVPACETSPGKNAILPSIYLPHLHTLIPCSYWTSACGGALSSDCAFYAVPVRQARGLPPSSFRFRVTADTFDLSYALPATGRARVFHPLDCAHAGHTPRAAKGSQGDGSFGRFLTKRTVPLAALG